MVFDKGVLENDESILFADRVKDMTDRSTYWKRHHVVVVATDL